MLRSDYEGQICSIARSLELVGERWTLLVIRDVFRGKRRFDEIQQSLGIARNVLTSRLERLVEEDILERRLYSEKPKRYEYFLTEKGLDLWPVLVTLMHWGDQHFADEAGPPMVLLHKGECGGEVSERGICERCGRQLTAREARLIDGPGMPEQFRSTEATPA
ncbi:MAG: winged helix-turn-helix transcriptional regulator [Solirubrobacterales bacterium]